VEHKHHATALKHLVSKAGGFVAIFGAIGVILGLERAGMIFAELKSFGGASGGALVMILLAAGKTPREIFKIFLEPDMVDFLPTHNHLLTYIRRRFSRTQAVRLANALTGYFASEKLGAFLQAKVSEWPSKFWTVLITLLGDQLFCHEGGIVLLTRTGRRFQLTTSPPDSIAAILSAACGVPELIEATPPERVFGDMSFLHLSEEERREVLAAFRCEAVLAALRSYDGLDSSRWANGALMDGAFSSDGMCPMRTVLRELSARPDEVIACAPTGVRFEVHLASYRALRKLLPVLPRLPYDARLENQGELAITPWVPRLGPLEAHLTLTQKLDAVFAGFEATMRTLGRLQCLGQLPPGLRIPSEMEQFGTLIELVELSGDVAYGRRFRERADRRHKPA
jgi:hypothetical protein